MAERVRNPGAVPHWEGALTESLRATATEIADSLADSNDNPAAVELALGEAVTRATAAGQWDAVQALVGELQARRRARAGVTELDAERVKRKGGAT